MKTKVYKIYVPEVCWDHFLQFCERYGYRKEEIAEYRTEPLITDHQISIDVMIRREK